MELDFLLSNKEKIRAGRPKFNEALYFFLSSGAMDTIAPLVLSQSYFGGYFIDNYLRVTIILPVISKMTEF